MVQGSQNVVCQLYSGGSWSNLDYRQAVNRLSGNI